MLLCERPFSKDVTQTQQQRPESPTVTLTWHVSKCKAYKLCERYILILIEPCFGTGLSLSLICQLTSEDIKHHFIIIIIIINILILIEPCFGTGLSLSLICQLTSEDIKHHFIIIIINILIRRILLLCLYDVFRALINSRAQQHRLSSFVHL